MNDDFAQRRRVAVALALTVILVPAAFLLDRGRATDDPAAEPGVLVGTVPGDEVVEAPAADTSANDGPNATDPMGTTPVAYLDGTVPPQPDDPATIAIPRLPESLSVTATFSNDISDPTACRVRDLGIVPYESQVTVKNLDNSRSVQCVASIGGAEPDEGIVLSSVAFLQIGDLTDAPISVEITW